MNVREIVRKYLEDNKFGGLFNEDGDCGCELSDLFPCAELGMECEPGFRTGCPKECGEHQFHISKEKPTEVYPYPIGSGGY